MLNYYIFAVAYDRCSGGSVALHKLAHDMTILGHNAILVGPNKNPWWRGKLMTMAPNGDPNGVAIYPEIVNGNPYNMPVVVRWILTTPGLIGGNGIFELTDLIYKYCNIYKVRDESMVKGELATWTLEDTLAFNNEGKHKPRTTCYLVRKGFRKTRDKHPSNALCIDDFKTKGGHDYLRWVFNEYETFISYDHYCYISNLAAISGCKSIIIPEGNVTPEEFKKGDPFKGYGRAYGFDEIPWAIKTQPLLRNTIVEIANKTNDQIKQLVKDCEEAWRFQK